MQAIWADGIAPKTPLSGPSREARQHLIDLPIDYMTGDRVNGGGNFTEHFRLDADGRLAETQYQMVSREDAYSSHWNTTSQGYWAGAPGADEGSAAYGRPYPPQGWQPVPQPASPEAFMRGLFAPLFGNPANSRAQARHDPDYFWGGRPN